MRGKEWPFHHVVCFFLWGQAMERGHRRDYLLGISESNPTWLAKIAFLAKVEPESRSRVKSKSGVLGFSINDAILDL